MSKRGRYIGGHTVVGSGSDWFSGRSKKSKKRTAQAIADRQVTHHFEMRQRAKQYIEECRRQNRSIEDLPPTIRAEIREAGGIDNWLAYYAPFKPSAY